MNLKTVTWNIGGGRLLKQGKDPGLMSSYTVEGLDDIVATLAGLDPDIIALQEAEGSIAANQVAYIAEKLGREYFFFDPTSASHLDTTQNLGNGLISRFPIQEHEAGVFHNPNIEFNLEGTTVTSHDKGYGRCLIAADGFNIRASTLHLLPFRKIGIELDSAVAQQIYQSIADRLESTDEIQLIQGDFNIDDAIVSKYLGNLFTHNGLEEIELSQPTTPKGRRYDHVLSRGLSLQDVHIDTTVKTDHYPVICTFQTLAAVSQFAIVRP